MSRTPSSPSPDPDAPDPKAFQTPSETHREPAGPPANQREDPERLLSPTSAAQSNVPALDKESDAAPHPGDQDQSVAPFKPDITPARGPGVRSSAEPNMGTAGRSAKPQAIAAIEAGTAPGVRSDKGEPGGTGGSGGRLRRHPEQRFYDSPMYVFDFAQAVQELRDEATHGGTKNSSGHRQRALYSRGPVTVAVFDLQPGGMIREHVVINGSAIVQPVSGHVIVRSDVGEHDVQQGQVLCIAPGVRHDVTAPDGAQMLLTVCLEFQPAKSKRPKAGASSRGNTRRTAAKPRAKKRGSTPGSKGRGGTRRSR